MENAGLTVQGYYEKKEFTEVDIYSDTLLPEIINKYGVHQSYITCWDPLAYQLISFLSANGKKVPEDVRIVSCGNAIPQRDYSPVLTTVDRKFEEIGQKAAEFLFEQIENPEAEPKRFVAQPELVIRNSSTKP